MTDVKTIHGLFDGIVNSSHEKRKYICGELFPDHLSKIEIQEADLDYLKHKVRYIQALLENGVSNWIIEDEITLAKEVIGDCEL